MAGGATHPSVLRVVSGALISLALAIALVAATTALRATLTPYLGSRSPFMLYVAAVLVAGLVRGPLCGALVMLGGGLAGFRLFLVSQGEPLPGAELCLMLFWAVSAPVLIVANQLRVQLKVAMQRLSEALRRHSATMS